MYVFWFLFRFVYMREIKSGVFNEGLLLLFNNKHVWNNSSVNLAKI